MPAESNDNRPGAQLAAEQKKTKLTREELVARLLEISGRCAALRILDDRTPDEIIGYNEHGVFD